MMKKAVIAGLVLTGFVASTHAVAGLYGSLSAGIGGMDTKKYSNNSNPFSNVSLRDGAAYRGALGYLMDGEVGYGLEMGYTGYPNNIYKNNQFNLKDTYTGNTIDLLAVAKYRTSSGFFMVGKGGAARVYQKVNGQFEGTSQTKKSDKVKPEVALGVGYDLSESFAIDATFNHIFGGQANPNSTTSSASTVSAVSTLMGGLTYNFS